MSKAIEKSTINRRKRRVNILLGFLLFAMLLFLFSVVKTISKERRIPSHNKTLHDRAFRGAIISKDGYTLSNSEKNYKAVVRGASIKPEKRELFITLFSIYSGLSEKDIRQALVDSKGKAKQSNIILSKTIHTNTAMQLKALALKLRRLGVFQSIKNRAGINVLYGLDIIEVGEYRRFPLHDVLSPVLGYMKKVDNGKYIRPRGEKGLEGNYNEHITSKKDGFFKGKRDVLGAIIHDKNSINRQRVDGLDLHLNISLDVQRRVEYMIDEMKAKTDAEQILVAAMESNTGKLLTIASTERFDPAHIHQCDVPALDPKFSEYPYEAGSVLKPLTLAIALEHKVITPNTWIETGYKNFDITGGQHINDDEFFSSQTATDIIVHSSNIGISQISWRLTGKEFRDGLLNFGLAQKSGLDLNRDLPGFLKSEHILNHKMHRANSAFGYGMTVTFAQLIKAYSAFNNDGTAMTPRIVNYLGNDKGQHYILKPRVGDKKAISKETSAKIHHILQEVVKRGTGVKAQYIGLDIGGKTGTAHIAKHGGYSREYHSSFYGFANDDKGHKYTIGVLVIKAKKPYAYFASASAVPTFRNIVDILVKQGYLMPNQKAVEAYKKRQEMLHPTPVEQKSLPQVWEKKKAIKKKKSVKSLFKLKKKPAQQKKKRHIKKPIIKKSPTELFEDLF